MKRIKSPELQTFLSHQIEKGNFVEIAAPEQRSTNDWVLIDQQHSRERSREQDLNILIPRSQYVVSVLNPANGVIAALAVEPPQPSLLDDGSTPNDSAPPLVVAQRTTRSIEMKQELDHRVATTLNTDTPISFDELAKIAGSPEELKDSLKRLKRFKNHGMNVQTIDQLISIEPEKILAKSVPGGKIEQVTLTYMGLETASGGELMLNLQIQKNPEADTTHTTSPIIRERTRLNTINNQRTLKVLQAGQLMDIEVQAEVQMEFDLRTRKWVCVLIGLMNEVNLLERMGPVGAYITENF